MTEKNNYAIGVDIGGSHVTVAAVDLIQKEVNYGSRTRMRVNAGGTADDILRLWGEAIRYVLHFACCKQATGIGIAMPGPFDYEKGISHIRGLHKYESLFGLNIREKLSGQISRPPESIVFENDAACFLSGEVINGAARGCRSAVGITLGTGLGSAYFHDGQAREATLYKMPFRDSIAEDYLSTRWFVKRYRELSGREVKDVKELVQQLRVDRTVQIVFEEFGHTLSLCLLPWLQEHNPEVLVVGGNIANAWELFSDPLIRGLSDSRLHTRVVKSTLGENAILLGAAGLTEGNAAVV
ncbi:ROK family protein [Compostibacter hankyongensis]|uniref:ROK family protein n=1 Tax=Compostibacter hankyongensis TaxID=1007089 RepID=A0ABP8FLF2_9BACT